MSDSMSHLYGALSSSSWFLVDFLLSKGTHWDNKGTVIWIPESSYLLCTLSVTGKWPWVSLLFFGTLHSNGYLSFSPLPFISVLFTAICKASSDNHFAFLHCFFLRMVLITASCTTSVHSSSGTLCLSDIIPWVYLSLPLYNHKGFDLDHTWMV